MFETTSGETVRHPACYGVLGLLLSLFVCAGGAKGATIYQVEATNMTNVAVHDIHVAFTGTGGLLSGAMPLLPNNWTAGITGGNIVDGDWNNTVTIGVGGTWRAQFSSELGGIVLAGGFWTDQNNQKVQGGDIPADKIKLTELPEPNYFLAVFAAGSVLVMLRRLMA